MYTNLDIYELL